ncbi:hypothetical protein DJICPGNB_01745 [Proteus mirabilis]|nr:hypothetical protein DJICPGNB_01745 [Proteus mirabilis]
MHFFSPIKLKTNNNCCEGSSRKYNEPVFQTHFSAGVAELVDAVDSKSTAFGCAGSSPAFGTIRTSRDVNGRLFLYLKSSVCKAFPAFSVNACQSNSTHINLRVSIHLSIYIASIMFVYSLYLELPMLEQSRRSLWRRHIVGYVTRNHQQ